MLQPVPLRGAGGHSRQWAEPCWRFTHRLAQPPPTLPLPFIFPTITLFQTIHPLQLSFISPSLPAHFPLLSPSPSICMSPQTVAAKDSDIHQMHSRFFFHWFSSSRSVFPAAHSPTPNWTQLNALKKSQGFNDHCPCAFAWVSTHG